MSKHYIGEVGSDLLLDCGILIGSATEQHIKFKKPSGVTGSFSGSLYSSYSLIAKLTGTYFVKHTLIASDFDVPGLWKFQAYVGAIDGTWLGETTDLNIYGAFE